MKCYDYAIKFIYRTPKTEQDLRIKLFQKGYSSDEVALTMEILKHKKYIDDETFAQMYINSEVIRKGKPMIAVSQKLRQKGIDKDITKKIINEYESEITEGIHKKIRKDIDNYKKKDVTGFDIIQKLMRKGYKLDDIKDVIKS